MLTDDGYRQIMQHARRLAQGGRGELAQHLRDAIDLRGEVQRLRDVLTALLSACEQMRYGDRTFPPEVVEAMTAARKALEGDE